MTMKNEIKPLYTNLLVRLYTENPYVVSKTDEGFVFVDDEVESTDSGEKEKLDLGICCAEVLDIGPDCKYVKPGDDVFYHLTASRPIPFKDAGFFVVSEVNVITVMSNDLTERFNK